MGWKYYNHAMIPDTPPDVQVDITALKDGSIWKLAPGKRPLLARWTTDFDCARETAWWYVIREGTYDLSQMKAKRRYEITRARKNFRVCVIDPKDYAQALFQVQQAAFEAYPAKYRPHLDRDDFLRSCQNWQGICLGAFSVQEPQRLCGYVRLLRQDRCIHFQVQKADPGWERSGVNAALVDGVLTCCDRELRQGCYICDGQRNINHETAFQDYLEKYFGFRKAYCRLEILYHPLIRWAIPVCYRCRGLLARLDRSRLVHLINSALKMEQIIRQEGR